MKRRLRQGNTRWKVGFFYTKEKKMIPIVFPCPVLAVKTGLVTYRCRGLESTVKETIFLNETYATQAKAASFRDSLLNKTPFHGKRTRANVIVACGSLFVQEQILDAYYVSILGKDSIDKNMQDSFQSNQFVVRPDHQTRPKSSEPPRETSWLNYKPPAGANLRFLDNES